MSLEPQGFRAGAAKAGVKTGVADRLDVGLIVSDRPCVAAGVFTTNQVIAAPCVVTRRHLERGTLRAIAANSGIANACTGEQGDRDAVAMAKAAADVVGCSPYEVGIASTGVIGWRLPVERIATAFSDVKLSPDGFDDFAHAIMTTDTRPKLVTNSATIGGKMVRVRGIAKGAGMIHPNMATLLAFVVTDASVPLDALRGMAKRAADRSLNAISVDGEGATKVFAVHVTGAASDDDARRAARTITNSNLVKTAIHGADPNWGRILAAAGRSGARVDDRRASVRIGPVDVFRDGAPVAFDPAAVRGLFEQTSIDIALDLGLGHGSAIAWGCDLSAEYVRINAEYTT